MGSDSEDPGRSASLGSSGISRRALTRAVSALGITATAFRALPASAASGSRSFLGSNLDIFETIKSGETINGVAYPGVTGLSSVRMYGEHPTKNSDGTTWTDHVRSTWPQPIPAWVNDMHQYGSNSIGVLTFWNPTGGLSGPWDPSRPWGKSTINDMNYIINKHILTRISRLLKKTQHVSLRCR